MMGALRVTQRNWNVYWKVWRQSLIFSFLQPLLFLSAMGIGVGALVQRNDATAFGGVGYMAFIAPGLLASTAMQTAAFESAWPIMGKIVWMRIYDGMLATPLSVRDIVKGEMMWLALRLTTICSIYLAVISTFKIPVWPSAIMALPFAVLTGLAFGSVITSFTARMENSNGFNGMFRFVITPLFLFSGTFFPIERLPEAVRPIAYVTPLYHGVAPIRGFVLGTMPLSEAASHGLYLLAMFGIGFYLANKNLTKRLIK